MDTSDPLLRPYRLKHLTLRNRVMSTAHEPYYSEDGMPKDRYRLYHVEKARGGVALTMTAGSAVVSPDSPPVFGNLLAYKDEIVPWLRRLSDECHEHGAAVMIQITHLGRRTAWNKADWLPVLAPSPIREPAHRSFPKAIEDWDIDRIVADYAAAAQRMQAAGLDGLEINAYGHLPDQFWSPATNQREDAFGGSLDERMAFSLRVMQAMRDAVGPDFLLGLRMVADEDWEIGLSRAEGIEIARRFKASGLVDFLNIIRGHIETDNALTDVIPIAGMRSAPHLDFAGEVRAATDIPVFHAARINDVATARHAIAAGKLDMVGMTRALIADPHIARKVRAGQEHLIRPCVGASYCIDRIYEGNEALCIHNAATGREATMPQVIAAQRRAAAPRRRGGRRPGRAGGRARRGRARPCGAGVRGGGAGRRPGAAGRALAAPARTDRHRRLAPGRTGTARASRCALRPGRRPTTCWRRRPTSCSSPPAACPNTEVLESGNDLVVSTWDIVSGAVKPGAVGADLRRQRQPPRNAGGGTARRVRRRGGDRHARADVRAGTGRPESRRLCARAATGGGARSPSTRACCRCGARATAWPPRSAAITRHGRRNGWSIRWWSSTARCRWTSCTTRCGRDRSISARSITRRCWRAGRRLWFATRTARYRLLRIGDAVASRNIHAAVFDGLRYAKDL